VIAPTRPSELIRSGQHGIDFGTSEELDQGAGEALAGDGEHTLDLCRMCWCFIRRVSKERVNRREAQITTANAQALALLQLIQESDDQGASISSKLSRDGGLRNRC
jgi:hypothetical protein